MIKIGTVSISEIDSVGDFEIQIGDCFQCGTESYTYLNEEEAHSLMYFLKKQLHKRYDLINKNQIK